VPEEAPSANKVESWPEIDELCKHLIRIGLKATVESKEVFKLGPPSPLEAPSELRTEILTW